jgi:hypothetical protein
MSHFGRSLRWAQISILEILHVFLRLKFSPALTSAKLKRFEIGSFIRKFLTAQSEIRQLTPGSGRDSMIAVLAKTRTQITVAA